MADASEKDAVSAEKAYAAAAAAKAQPEEAPAPAVPTPAPSLKYTPKAAPKKGAAKAKPPRPAARPAISQLKDKIMANAKTADFTQPISQALGEFQTRAKAAYEKSTEAMTEATEFAKGNVEALVESGKILAAGAQDLGKTYVEEARTAYETLTGDLKDVAAVKSPTELFQLQGKILRRNFDLFVAAGSKNTEAVMKLAQDAFAPISGRVGLAAERIAKAA